MSVKKVVVVIRNYPLYGKNVVSAVIAVPDNVLNNADILLTNWTNEVVKNHKNKLCEKFIEFASAKWTHAIHNLE